MTLPRGHELKAFLDLEGTHELDDLFESALNGPLDTVLGQPGKSLRRNVVRLGFDIAARYLALDRLDDDLVLRGGEILEIFHAGSLVVDDIEDGSLYRRGQHSMHHRFGLPLALNAGNYLYFLPFQLIERMDLPETRKRALARECQLTLLRAHYGQAIDLGVRLDHLSPERVPEVAMATMELKSGVLMGLALSLGALALGAPAKIRVKLNRFGRRLGIALQMFDDVGNLRSHHNPEKACEDLKLNRLGHVFGTAARELSAPDFARLSALARLLPESCDEVLSVLDDFGVPPRAATYAALYFEAVLDDMQSTLGLTSPERETLNLLRARLEQAYV